MTPPRSGTCCLRSASSSRSVWATRISNRFEPRTASTDGPRFDSWSGGDRLPASRAHASNGSSGEPDRTRGSGASSIVRSWRSPVECACRLFRRETSYCSSCSPAAPRTPGTWSSCWPVRIATRRSPKSRPTSATCRPGAGSSGAGLSEAGPPEEPRLGPPFLLRQRERDQLRHVAADRQRDVPRPLGVLRPALPAGQPVGACVAG